MGEARENIDRFTPEQEHAIGQLMVENWGGHMQTGFTMTEEGRMSDPVLWVKMGPATPIRDYRISEDGTVVMDG